MCIDHPDNASDALKDWLQSLRIKFTVSVIVANVKSDDSYYEQLRNELTTDLRVDKSNRSPISRDSLQSGDSAKMMDNNEVLEFFSSDMRRMKSKAKVHGIPDGEAVFVCARGRSEQGRPWLMAHNQAGI